MIQMLLGVRSEMKLVAYKYQCDDRSILLLPFKKWLVSPVFRRLIPWGLPANIITIISNMFLYCALYLAVSRVEGENWYFPVIGLLIYLYNLGDHLDGMQAKHTSTGSQLGEFCDHFLDGFNDGILLIIILSLFHVANIYFAAGMFTFFYIAHASVMFEEFKTKWLVFEKYSSLEGIFLIIGLIVFSGLPQFYNLLTSQVFGDLRVIEIFLIFSIPGSVSTFARVGKRIKGFSLKFCLFILLLIITAASGVFLFNNYQLYAVMTLYAGSYVGLVMRGHLVDGKERYPDIIVPAGLIISLLLMKTGTFQYDLFTFVIAYLVAYVLLLVISTVVPLRKYWVWVNPKTPSVAGKRKKR
jgi:phosphatidylglycerophosphate synthase